MGGEGTSASGEIYVVGGGIYGWWLERAVRA